MILLRVQAVSAFVSHGAFCTVTVFDSQDEPFARPSRIHTGLGNNRDSYAAIHAPEAFFAASRMPESHNISGDLPTWDGLQKTGHIRHTSSLGTIQADP